MVLDLLQTDDVGIGAQEFGHQLFGLDFQLLGSECPPAAKRGPVIEDVGAGYDKVAFGIRLSGPVILGHEAHGGGVLRLNAVVAEGIVDGAHQWIHGISQAQCPIFTRIGNWIEIGIGQP